VIADIWTGKARLNPPRIYIYRFFSPKYFDLQTFIGCGAVSWAGLCEAEVVSILDRGGSPES